jgi:hypothetical protein
MTEEGEPTAGWAGLTFVISITHPVIMANSQQSFCYQRYK